MLRNRIYILIFSLLLTILCSIILYFNMTPYNLLIKERMVTKNQYKYVDLDDDGYSELLRFGFSEQTQQHYITIYNNDNKLIDQFNIASNTNLSWIYIEDYNDDRFNEIIIFSRNSNSIYVSIIDVKTQKQIVVHQKILARPQKTENIQWDFKILFGGFIDSDQNGNKEILFAVISGLSKQPRSVYLFELEKNQMIREFNTASTFTEIYTLDLNGDNFDEIVLQSTATGNIEDKSNYDDQFSRLFILNQELVPIFEPLQFEEYPSSLKISPIIIDFRKYLLATSYYKGQQNKSGNIFLINWRGKILNQIKNGVTKNISSALVHNDKINPYFIYCCDNNLFKVNQNFDIISKTVLSAFIQPHSLIDLNIDGEMELVGYYPGKILIFNDELKLCSEKELSEYKGELSFKQNGPFAQQDIFIRAGKEYLLLGINENFVFSFFPLVTVGLFLMINISTFFMFKLYIFASIYIGFMVSQIKESKNGLLILNSNGKVFYFNHTFLYSLQLQKPNIKKKHYSLFLADYEDILNLLNSVFKSRQAAEKIIELNINKQVLKYQLTVKPIVSPIKIISGYIIEVLNLTNPVLTDRAKVWSKTVQKMAHDIKTPLSSITVGLKTLQFQLEKEKLTSKEKIFFEMKTMRSEIDRVREMTKSFLKFTNLEKPNFQLSDIHLVLQNSINRFQDYFRNDMVMKTEFDPKIEIFDFDSQQLEMVFNILIENSIDAVKSKGIINISSTIIENVVQEFNNKIEIQFNDNGVGISKVSQSKIFEPYFTDKKDGTGMGLAIAKKIIEDHSGVISVYSEGGLGTTFTITLPYHKNGESNA